MSIKGKVETIIRLIGSTIILISIILSILANFLIIHDVILFVLYLIFTLALLSMSIMKKTEQGFFIKYNLVFLIVTLFLSLILILVGYIYHFNENLGFNLFSLYFISILSSILIIACWHYSLSIYKIKKYYFTISGIANIILNLFSFTVSMSNNALFIILPTLLILISLLLILISEYVMKKKGYLNYI
ncbi:MAG: hypothetical protein ACTSPN_06040 [Promethearchaeota archaeon]